MNLTFKEKDELYMAIVTRIRTVETLMSSWAGLEDEDSKYLLERYSFDLEVLKGLEEKVLEEIKLGV